MQSRGLVSRSLSFAVMFVLTVFAALCVFNTKAQAVEYTPTISNATYTTLVGSNVRVNFDYALNNGAPAQPGDTFTIMLPAELENNTPAPFEVMGVDANGNSISVGTATPTSNPNTMTVTFNNNIAGLLNVHGQMSFSLNWSSAIAQRGNGSTTLNIGNTSLNMTYGGSIAAMDTAITKYNRTGATAETTYTLPSGATITTGNDYYVTSWVVNLTPSDITQVGLLNATVKDQIVNPYTVDASKLTGTGVNPSDELAGPYLKHSFVLHLVNGAVQTLSADQILPAITFTPNGYTLDFARLNNQVNFAGFQPLIQDCWLEYKTIVPANVTQVDNRATLDFDGNTDNFTREGWWINPRGAGTATGEQQVSVSVSKVWEDQNNADGTRPTSVTVHLYADGVDTGKSEVLSDANGWTATFSNLDKNQTGTTTAITYTVVEDEVEGYTAEVTGDVTSGFTITNTHIPPTPTTPPSETPKKPKQPKKKEPKLPSTGDASFAAVSVAAASSVLIAAGVLGKKRVQ